MINSINSLLFKQMLLGANQMLQNNKKLVDVLNVFPVPDGDTGTNMSLTMTSVINEVKAIPNDDMTEIAKALSRGALKGARGNSGVILSQILKGISEGLVNIKTITAKDFANAMKRGTEVAYSAVTKPKEGTILTVIRVMTENALTFTKRKIDIDDFFEKVLKVGEDVLNKTPDMLPVLKKAGVVDAGGRGLLFIFKGMYEILIGNDIPEQAEENDISNQFEQLTQDEEMELGDIKYMYCTEFFITDIYPKVTEADIDKLRDLFLTLGDCVIVIGDLSLVKVHIHTNNPDRALKAALLLGELDKIKIDNMVHQNRAIKEKKEKEQKEKDAVQQHKENALISIVAGDGISKIFREFNANYIVAGGQTMNPSVEDILDAINKVNADNVFILPNNKNIILASEQAKELATCNVFVIPTTDIPQGISVALAYNPEDTAENNDKKMRRELNNIKCGQITHAVRNTSIDGFDVNIGDYIGLDGKKIIAKSSEVSEVTIDTIGKLIDEDSELVTLYYGAEVKEKEAEELAAKIEEKYPDLEVTYYYGGQPHYYYLIGIE